MTNCANRKSFGIALEQFDPIGRWRDEGRNGSELSATLVTRDGVTLESSAGLKEYLTDHRTS